MAIKACLTVRCNSTTPTLAKSRIPGDEGTRYRISGSTATSIYWTTMGISIRPSGLLPAVQNQADGSLESHMMCCHLGLGQLWRCPVEWCAVWKGSVRECQDHFNDKHSGSATLDFENVSRSFPAWTVTRKFWEQALKPKISGIAVDVRMVHKYRVYRDPIPHPALREGKITKLLSFVNRAMDCDSIIGHSPGGKCQVTASRKPQNRQLRRNTDE